MDGPRPRHVKPLAHTYMYVQPIGPIELPICFNGFCRDSLWKGTKKEPLTTPAFFQRKSHQFLDHFLHEFTAHISSVVFQFSMDSEKWHKKSRGKNIDSLTWLGWKNGHVWMEKNIMVIRWRWAVQWVRHFLMLWIVLHFDIVL